MRVFGHMLKAVAATALAAAAALSFIGPAAANQPGKLASLTATAPVVFPDTSVRRVADKKSDAAPRPKVTREQAEAIALKVVPGKITSVEIEPKRGKLVYAVEIMTPHGEETDVLVDTETGEVLGTEN